MKFSNATEIRCTVYCSCVGKLFSHSLQSLVPIRILCMHMGTRLCKEWENNFPTQLQYTLLLISSHFEHYGSVSVPCAQCKCIGHGPRSRFRSVQSEMKSTVLPFAIPFENPVFRVFHFITHTQTDSLI